jgi:hypothetical protein
MLCEILSQGAQIAAFRRAICKGWTQIPDYGITVRVVVPGIPLSPALMVVVPALTPVARSEPLIFATDVLDDDQFALDVMFCVLSVYVPVAVNCSVAPAL